MPEPQLREWIDLARTVTVDDRERFAPPPDLFDRIAAEVELDADAPAPEPEPAPVLDLEQARVTRAPQAIRRRHRQLAVAAAAAAVVLVLGFSAFTGEPDSPSYIAEATNADLPEPYSGSASATITGNQLAISFSSALPDDEPLELWLIRPDLSDMVSLGLLDDQGTYSVPAGYDPSEYSLVDVSIEPQDGDPTHSGRSILRGELQST